MKKGRGSRARKERKRMGRRGVEGRDERNQNALHSVELSKNTIKKERKINHLK